jgi:hypothetical protein
VLKLSKEKLVLAVAMTFPMTVAAQQLHAQGDRSIRCDPETGCGTGGGGDGGGGGSGTSNPSIVYHKVDTVEHTAEMRLSNGAVLVIDYPLNKVFLSGGGHSAELSLDDVLLQRASGNTQVASSLKSQIRSKLYQSGLMVELDAVGNDPGLLYRKRNKRRTQGLMAGPSGGSGYSCYYDWYCYERQFVVYDGGGGGWGFDANFWGYETAPPSGSDYNYWQIWRNDHCDAAQNDFIHATYATATMAVGCAFFATGVGAAACAVGAIGVVVEMNSMAGDAADCLSNYPGYGNWGH